MRHILLAEKLMSALDGWRTDSQPRHPWYKERLHKKILKESNQKLNLSGALNSCHWKFLPRGADDFRDGYPSSSDTSSISSTKGHAPVLQNITRDPEPAQKPRKRFTKQQSCYSKLLPLQQARQEYIAEIEYGLTQHPLVLYPHLEECLPPDLFEQIVDLLDPEMRLKSASGCYEAIPEEQEEESSIPPTDQQEWQSEKSRHTSTRQSAMSEQSRLKNPYTWLSKQEETVQEEKKSKITHPFTPAPNERVKHVTKEFCDWVNSLGGEPCNINESTIFSLFASGFDTKPPLSVPIHVVELNNVPAELKMYVGNSPQEHSAKTSPSRNVQLQSKEPTYFPSWVKTRYGAWYLEPNTWKKHKVNEPLTDPAVEKTIRGMHSTHRLSQKDEDLMQLHGTVAFKDFIEMKGYRKPHFINKIFPRKDAVPSESPIPTGCRTASSGRNTWYRSSSASTHEDSIIN
ncbi:protein FAM47E [Pseudophryne corroboree]|uniref:protein FAM47E n=1 Tax=Pseudophryne corroboree TaxID=495146 RepID=UPI00308194BA